MNVYPLEQWRAAFERMNRLEVPKMDNYGTLVDVVTALSIRFTNGACGTFAATSLSHENWREEFSFYGSEGVLNIRDGQLTLHKNWRAKASSHAFSLTVRVYSRRHRASDDLHGKRGRLRTRLSPRMQEPPVPPGAATVRNARTGPA